MATVKDWESFVADTKTSILVALDVPDLSLCEIKMRKLNKQRISETGFY